MREAGDRDSTENRSFEGVMASFERGGAMEMRASSWEAPVQNESCEARRGGQ